LRSLAIAIMASTTPKATMVVIQVSMPMLKRTLPSAAISRPATPATVEPMMSQRFR
jgi:hypothetical protein